MFSEERLETSVLNRSSLSSTRNALVAIYSAMDSGNSSSVLSDLYVASLEISQTADFLTSKFEEKSRSR